jgi:apolipoprotein N-acyltransferase
LCAAAGGSYNQRVPAPTTANRLQPWILAGVSGCLLLLAFPPFGLWPLAWIALIPLLRAAREAASPKDAANLGGFAGLVFYAFSLGWFRHVFNLPVSIGFWCIFATWIALFAALARWLWDRWRVGLGGPERELGWALACGVVWTGIEYFRSEVWFLNNAWLALGFSQVPCPPVLQTCAVAGVYGLSCLLVFANAAFGLALRGRCATPLTALALVLGLAGWGAARVRHLPVGAGTPLRVALVQDETFSLDRHARLSLGPEARDARLIVWPEVSISVPPRQEERHRQLVAGRLKGSRAITVLGVVVIESEDPKTATFRNFAWVLAPGGALLGRYDKLHPIPVVEAALPPNADPWPVSTPVGRLGIQICYDLDFENGSRLVARRRADLLVVPNLDPWEWGQIQHLQHSAMAPVRAVETGLWIVRAASSGASQIIDPAGRVRGSLVPGTEGVLAGEVFVGRRPTAYLAGGWWTGRVCLFLTILLALAGFAWPFLGNR